MENLKVIRKVIASEIGKNRTIFGPNAVITMRIRSRLDLFERLDQVRAGIHAWKSMHQFLRAKIVPKDEDFYYVIDEDSSANRNLENIKFLRVQKRQENGPKKQIDDEEEFLYELVFEKYNSDLIDCEKEHDLLWRLAFLELPPKDNLFGYEIYWVFNHLIGDGCSVKENMLLLLSLIEKSMKGETIEPVDFGVYPGNGKLFEAEISAIGETNQIEPVVKPSFVDPAQARISSSTSINKYFTSLDEIDDFDLIDLNRNGGERYATRNELIQFSQTTSYEKPKRFVITQDRFLKLQKK